MSSYQPHLFIGVGATGAFFTLRETEQVWVGRPPKPEVRSFHHFNLSQDPDEAIEKATRAAEALGLQLITTRERLAEELREIQRANADELAAREEQRIKWERERAETNAAIEAFRLDLLSRGIWPLPKGGISETDVREGIVVDGADLKGEPCFYRAASLVEIEGVKRYTERVWNMELIRSKPVGLLTWWARTEFESDIAKALQAWIRENCADLILPEPVEGYVGEPGARIEVSARAVRRLSFASHFGPVYLTILVDDATGRRLVVKSGAWAANEGARVRIKATIKEHALYQGKTQTILQRVKELPVEAAA